MGIIKRFFNVLSANANAAIDEIENPEAMINMQLRTMNNELAKVKADTASVLAVKKGLERKIEKLDLEITELDNCAALAIKENNEDDARIFIDKKLQKEEKLAELNNSLEIANINAEKMLEMHNQYSESVSRNRERGDLLKSKIKVTKTQTAINNANKSCEELENTMCGFDSLDEKITRKMDEAFALDECNKILINEVQDNVTALKEKYNKIGYNERVETELNRLKGIV